MRVRTRREGVDSIFTASESLCDVTGAFITLQGSRNVTSHTSAFNGIQYNVRIGSRTAFLLQGIASWLHLPHVTGQKMDDITITTPTKKNETVGVTVSYTEKDVFDAHMSADDELDRHDAFVELSNVLEEAFQWRGAFVDTNDMDLRYWSLLTPQVSRELMSRWVMQSLNDTTEGRVYRDALTLLDRGVTVRLCRNDTALYTVVDMADMTDGQYWVDVERTSSSPGNIMRVDRSDLLLYPPQPVYFDSLIPADELNSARGTSACLFLAATLAVRRLCFSHERATVLGNLRDFPRNVAIRMGHFARETRKKLYTQCLKRRSCCDVSSKISLELVEVRMTRDYVTLRYGGREIEVLQRTLKRLSLLWDARVLREREWTATGENDMDLAHNIWQREGTQQLTGANDMHIFKTSHSFFLRVFAMLLRYRSLLGDMGYNQGPHAAIPPVVLQQLHDAFDVYCEAFASPLNAQLPLFGSLFPDTDYYFGSLGAFFDLSLVAGHYEVNPPFVTAVLQKLRSFLLKDILPKHDGVNDPSMLFVIVLPSHDLEDVEREHYAQPTLPNHDCGLMNSDNNNNNNSSSCRSSNDNDTELQRKRKRVEGDDERDGQNVSTERILRNSVFCLAHTLCAAAESAYVDGHQHLLRAPLFCIGTPTRLIVLGNRTARRRYEDAAERLATVKETWRHYTLVSKTKPSNA